MPITTIVGLLCGVIAIIFVVLFIIALNKNKKNTKIVLIFAILFCGLFVASNWFVKYEINYYTNQGYILMKSIPKFAHTEYEEVTYVDYASCMGKYIFKINKEEKIIYMYRRIK